MRRAVAGLFVAAMLAVGCGSGGGSGSAATFCDDAKGLEERFNSFENDPDAFSFDTFNDILNELEDLTPPAEIEDDWNTFIGGVRQLVDTLEPIKDKDIFGEDADDPEVQAAFEEFQTISEDPDLTKATENVEKYLADECGVDINGS